MSETLADPVILTTDADFRIGRRPGRQVVPCMTPQGYAPLKQRRYDHRPTTQGAPKEAATLFPRVHRVFTHLKTWVWGTHRGVSRKHLPHDLNEFVFRFNRRRTRMAAFRSLLGLAGQHGPTTYNGVYDAESTG